MAAHPGLGGQGNGVLELAARCARDPSSGAWRGQVAAWALESVLVQFRRPVIRERGECLSDLRGWGLGGLGGAQVPGALQPGEHTDATVITIDNKDLKLGRVSAVAHEAECKPDPGDELLLTPPFCMALG